MKGPARVLIVDDHPLLRCGLVELIGKDPNLVLYGEADSMGTTILAVDNDPPPDLVILDLMLGYADGLELIKQIRALRPGLLILVISMHDELIYAERALRAGASGFIMKNEPSQEVLSAVHAVLEGGIYLSNRMRVLMSEKGLTSDPFRFLVPQANPPLSDRELHVFRLIGAGLATKQIADALHLSVKTIETYRENLKIKLRLANARELLSAARQWVDKAG
ncbi:MAG: response regulator transcription factor [Verrucomicrobia bacterium]|nr:response regulator transcription factor [Verrucomicrobiota bacterium]